MTDPCHYVRRWLDLIRAERELRNVMEELPALKDDIARLCPPTESAPANG